MHVLHSVKKFNHWETLLNIKYSFNKKCLFVSIQNEIQTYGTIENTYIICIFQKQFSRANFFAQKFNRKIYL